MQPYQAASQALRSRAESPGQLLQGAAGAGLAFAGGGLASAGARLGGIALGKVAPFLSKYIPKDLAIKGLSKIDPRFGKFIESALEEGMEFDEIKDFIGEKAEEGQPKAKAQENRNVIEQYSPELHAFINEQIQSGRSPLEAGALASLDRKGGKSFKSVIKKLEQDHKSPFSAILQSVYGGQEAASQQPQEGIQQQQQGQPQQGGQGQAALMAILQKIQQTRGGQ
jgi:hypothetical protein